MSYDGAEKHNAAEVDNVDSHDIHEKNKSGLADSNVLQEKNIHNSELLTDRDFLSSAFDAENKEHQQGVWEAVKEQPMV